MTAQDAPTAVAKAADAETPDVTPEAALEAADVTPVEKSTDATETAPDAVVEPVEAVAKAAGMDVETLRGMLMKLVRALPDAEVQSAFQAMAGTVNPTTDTAPAGDSTEPPAEPAAEPAAPAAPAVEVPAPDPGTGVLEPPTPDEPVQKATGFDADSFTARLAALFRTQVEEAVAPVLKRLEVVEATPVPGGPMLNGAVPGAPGSPTGTTEPYAAIQKMIDGIEDPAARRAAQGVAVHQILTGVISGQIATAPAQ